jgi:hypothetical protein
MVFLIFQTCLSVSVAIESSMHLTSDLTCTGTITIVGQDGNLNANGFTISSDQSPAIVIQKGGKLENAAISNIGGGSGGGGVGVRFDDASGLLDNVKYEGTGTAVEVAGDSENVRVSFRMMSRRGGTIEIVALAHR